MWRSCGEVTQSPVARLPKLWRDDSGKLWRRYQICGKITCGEVTLWRGYSHPNIPHTCITIRNFSIDSGASFFLKSMGEVKILMDFHPYRAYD